jgi:hypothetical protein
MQAAAAQQSAACSVPLLQPVSEHHMAPLAANLSLQNVMRFRWVLAVNNLFGAVMTSEIGLPWIDAGDLACLENVTACNAELGRPSLCSCKAI